MLTYGYVPHPKTAFRGVCKLEPGHYLEVDVTSGTWRKRRYWKVEPDARAISARRAAETLRELIDESVREQLMSDVPLGIFLSGGVDSSILATTVQRVQGSVSIFSIGFDDESRDETRYARIVGERLQAEQHVEKLSANSLRELLPRMAGWYDEPFADPSALPTYRVCELARRHATVALSGDGGDDECLAATPGIVVSFESDGCKTDCDVDCAADRGSHCCEVARASCSGR